MQDIRCLSKRVVESIFDAILRPTIKNSLLGLNFLADQNP